MFINRYRKGRLNKHSFCLYQYCLKWSILFGRGSDNKMLCMSNAKPSWCHLKDLKYMAVIAQNHNQKVIANLQYNVRLTRTIFYTPS
jgi:hypothetical protein